MQEEEEVDQEEEQEEEQQVEEESRFSMKKLHKKLPCKQLLPLQKLLVVLQRLRSQKKFGAIRRPS